MSTGTRYPLWVGPAAWLGALAIRLLGATWRITWEGEDPRGPCILQCWHSALVALVYTHRGRGIAVLVSRHLDAEIAARMAHRFGFVTARGSSTRGGAAGMLGMLELGGAATPLGMIPDGPRGPAETMKTGSVFLAARTGRPVIAVAAASSARWTIRSWDRLRVPKPFARVRVTLGEPVVVPAAHGPDDEERWRARLEEALRETNTRARAAVGEPA